MPVKSIKRNLFLTGRKTRSAFIARTIIEFFDENRLFLKIFDDFLGYIAGFDSVRGIESAHDSPAGKGRIR
jgi:hypothetical protein